MQSLNPSCPDCSSRQFCEWHHSEFLPTEQVAFQIRALTRQVAYEQERLEQRLQRTQQPGYIWHPFTEGDMSASVRMIRNRWRRLELYRAAFEMRGH